ncbi:MULTISPECIES: lytic transglycosylase domain-containing protein [unclassified Streptomyces]|uniref:lytic transglycosylase domain-containing protein n=1 Tax=unclassified Streptomyces TaxID=2593676 RepID=UPI0006AE4E49|nr:MULTISPECIES: lytic transglycosylase domain-containing protein [unclassified Streptomyces]KOX23016.1 lytic transglycosylase [Streptomyces sp. NRRL F-6491]KOX35621.1 lytic transglycosylase [Streptomyces sp. NRRL F-6492]
MAPDIGRRLRRGATSGAVVAAAVAALAASQAPEAIQPTTDNSGGDRAVGAGETAPPSGEGSATGDSPYYTELPPLKTPNKPGKPGTSVNLPVIMGPAEAGIPASVLSAYKRAEQSIRSTDPGCNLLWQLLAGIGKVESGQARGGRVDANGTTTSPILGPALNGVGFADISDTDGGAYDGDKVHDRAVGPMQFIPSTWATWGQDANGDGKKDPNNIYDAAQAAGLYLCANDRNLVLRADLDRAVLSYNRSTEYLNTVLSWFEYYKRGTHQVPDGTGVLPVDRSDNRRPSGFPSPTAPFRPAPTSPSPTSPAPKPGTQNPKPSEPSGPGTTKPPTVPKPPTTDPVPPPATPAGKVAALAVAANGQLTATTGSDFAKTPRVAALDASGKPVSRVSVRFEIVGTTDTRFAGGKTAVTATTTAAGIASSPALRAGEKTGAFKIRATVVGRTLDAADFAVTVTERRADTLVRVGDDPLSAATGTAFDQRVQVKATDKGALAPGVLVTAEIVTSKTDPKPVDGGPTFKSTSSRTATLPTATDGTLTFKAGDLLAGDKAGTYYLKLTAPGGGVLFVELKVAAPTTTPTPEPTETGTPEASTSPSPSTSPSSSSTPTASSSSASPKA